MYGVRERLYYAVPVPDFLTSFMRCVGLTREIDGSFAELPLELMLSGKLCDPCSQSPTTITASHLLISRRTYTPTHYL